MIQWMTAVAAKPGDLSIVPRPHVAGMSILADAHTQNKCERQNI